MPRTGRPGKFRKSRASRCSGRHCRRAGEDHCPTKEQALQTGGDFERAPFKMSGKSTSSQALSPRLCVSLQALFFTVWSLFLPDANNISTARDALPRPSGSHRVLSPCQGQACCGVGVFNVVSLSCLLVFSSFAIPIEPTCQALTDTGALLLCRDDATPLLLTSGSAIDIAS